MAERGRMMNVIIIEKDPNDPKDDTALRTIKVLVLQASPASTEKIYYTVNLPAINTRDAPALPSHHEGDPRTPRTNGILPDVRHNPTTLKGRWCEDAWARRALYSLGDYHILHAPSSDGGKVQNWFKPDLFQGDIFVLKVAVTSRGRGSGEPFIYDDILLNGTPKDEEDLVNELGHILDWKLFQGHEREMESAFVHAYRDKRHDPKHTSETVNH